MSLLTCCSCSDLSASTTIASTRAWTCAADEPARSSEAMPSSLVMSACVACSLEATLLSRAS
eukprot:7039825-Prymnesium_polylepis.1